MDRPVNKIREGRSWNIWIRVILSVAILLMAWGAAWGDGAIRHADLGDFRLEDGSVIRDCRLAYRILGRPDETRSNTVLVPTWFMGTTQELVDLGIVGPGKVIDTSRYLVVAVDAFGNGVSSSPSNSAVQSGLAFPQFSIRDMVRAQQVLLTEHLDIRRLHAVVGMSMGGMQVYQWMVAYPDFLDRAVPIVGTPWMTSYDLLLWSAELGILERLRDCRNREAAMKTLAPVHTLLLWPPRYRAAATAPDRVPEFLRGLEEGFLRYDPTDWAWQLKALMSQDIRRGFEGAERAAQAVKARTMVVSASQDQLIYSEPARALARLLNAETAELTGDCGHLAFLCETQKLGELVGGFLKRDRRTPDKAFR